MKKAFAIFLLTLAVLALCVTAFAAGSGSITISNATIGHTYKLYKIFDATLDISVTPARISYTYSDTLGKND